MHKYVRASVAATATALLMGPAAAVAGTTGTSDDRADVTSAPGVTVRFLPGGDARWTYTPAVPDDDVKPPKSIKVLACKVSPARNGHASARTVKQRLCFHVRDAKPAGPKGTIDPKPLRWSITKPATPKERPMALRWRSSEAAR